MSECFDQAIEAFALRRLARGGKSCARALHARQEPLASTAGRARLPHSPARGREHVPRPHEPGPTARSERPAAVHQPERADPATDARPVNALANLAVKNNDEQIRQMLTSRGITFST